MESAYQEAAAIKQWIDRGSPRRSGDEAAHQHPFNSDGINLDGARTILREANTTMVVVAPGLQEIRVCTAKPVSLNVERQLPARTSAGRLVTYHRIGSPKVTLPASSMSSPALLGPQANVHCCGTSISVATEAPTGTLGCLIRIDGEMHGLTANHVTGLCHHTDPDMPIIGPGTLDIRPGNPDPTTLGHHATCAPWRSGKQSNTNISDNLDLAVFRIKDEAALSSSQGWRYDTPVNVATTASLAAARDVKVWKVGRTTGMTTGQLFGQIGHSIAIPLAEKHFKSVVHFADLLVIENGDDVPFATAGDSGSLVVWKKDGLVEAVGILFCTSPGDEKAFLMPMEAVLGHFGATLVGGHNVQAGGIRGGPAPHGAARP